MAQHTPTGLERYETRDAHLGPLLKFAFWLVLATVLTFVAMWASLRGIQKLPTIGERDAHPLAVLNDPLPPAPNLEMQRGVKQGVDGKLVDLTQRQPFNTTMWSDVRAEAQKQITSYGWVDQDAKIVHVPIERAMELSLQKGFPVEQKVRD
jgi:hypothetical protein